MKNLLKIILAMFFLVGTAFVFIQCEAEPLMANDVLGDYVGVRGWNPPTADKKCPLLDDTYPIEELNADEVDALIFMVEEEKLARDVYLTLGERYDINVYLISFTQQMKFQELICKFTSSLCTEYFSGTRQFSTTLFEVYIALCHVYISSHVSMIV